MGNFLEGGGAHLTEIHFFGSFILVHRHFSLLFALHGKKRTPPPPPRYDQGLILLPSRDVRAWFVNKVVLFSIWRTKLCYQFLGGFGSVFVSKKFKSYLRVGSGSGIYNQKILSKSCFYQYVLTKVVINLY